jgi:hypothetical protein
MASLVSTSKEAKSLQPARCSTSTMRRENLQRGAAGVPANTTRQVSLTKWRRPKLAVAKILALHEEHDAGGAHQALDLRAQGHN